MVVPWPVLQVCVVGVQQATVGEPSDRLLTVCVQYGEALVVGEGECAYRVLEGVVDS